MSDSQSTGTLKLAHRREACCRGLWVVATSRQPRQPLQTQSQSSTEKIQQAKQALLLLPKLRSHEELQQSDLLGLCFFLSQLLALRELSTSTTAVHHLVDACIDQLTYISHGAGIVFDKAPTALQKAHYEMPELKHIPLLESLLRPVEVTIEDFSKFQNLPSCNCDSSQEIARAQPE